MGNNAVLCTLELAAIASCAWGLYNIQAYSNSILALTYNGFWFILGILSNLSGLASIAFTYFEEFDQMEKSHAFLQYHYLLAWFTVIVGYPTLVSSFWMVYYPTIWANLHVALSMIPVTAWMARQNKVIVVSTQVVCGMTIASHGYISYLAKNEWGMIGAGLMIFNVVTLSMPTRYNLFGLTSRESFILGLTSASYIFSLAVEKMSKTPGEVKSLVPW